MTNFKSAEFIRLQFGRHGACRSENLRSGKSPNLQDFRRLKSALKFSRHQLRAEARSMLAFDYVVNYGLKSVAWFALGCVINYGLKPGKEIFGF